MRDPGMIMPGFDPNIPITTSKDNVIKVLIFLNFFFFFQSIHS